MQTNIGKLVFNNPLYNASGVLCKTADEILKMNLSNSGASITKSCTLNERNGNPQPSYWENDKISINSMGLPNYSYTYYCEVIKRLPQKKHCFLSIANINNDETIKMLEYIFNKEYIQYPEINVSCPNIVGKEQLAYNLTGLDLFLKNVMTPHYNKPYGLKLPPFFDPVHINNICEVIKKYPNIKYLTCINSVGNVLDVNVDNNSGVIKPKNGLGGLGGDFILQVALSNVYQFKKNLPDIDIIGCGGVRTGIDLYKHILVGASMVQVGTTLNREGINCIDRILEEFRKEMLFRGFTSIDDFKGKYNYLNTEILA